MPSESAVLRAALIVEGNAIVENVSPDPANARGMRATDLQQERSAPSQVASGDGSTLTGGGNNTASGDYSTVIGGNGATSNLYGQVSHTSIYGPDLNASLQHIQFSRLTFAGVSTSDTRQDLKLNAVGDAAIILGDKESWSFRGEVTVRSLGESPARHGQYAIQGLVIRDVGASTVRLKRSIVGTLYEDDPNIDLSLAVDTASGALRIRAGAVNGSTFAFFGYIDVAIIKEV